MNGQSFWIITSVALMLAVTVSPFLASIRRAPSRDRTFYEVVTDSHHDLSHHVPEYNFLNGSSEFCSLQG